MTANNREFMPVFLSELATFKQLANFIKKENITYAITPIELNRFLLEKHSWDIEFIDTWCKNYIKKCAGKDVNLYNEEAYTTLLITAMKMKLYKFAESMIENQLG